MLATGIYGLPRALCTPAMTPLTRSAGCGGTHGSRPATVHFCRAGPACPAGGAGNNRSGRCRHRPLRKRILWCVGVGLSCPPLCRPTDGHCRARQSGHFLETGLLHPPLAALRRFPLPRATARVSPTEGLPIGFRRGRCGHRPASVTRGAVCGGTHGSRPTLHYFVGQGPCALPWVQGKTGSGRRGNRRSAASGR